MLSAHETGGQLGLGELQRWFLERVSGDPIPGAPERDIDELILPSDRLSASERLGVYTEMYFLRLHESLAEDYPGVRALLGDERFEELARAYHSAHPPRSFTLAHAGRDLPAFLASHPGSGGVAAREVALLERALTEAFDAPATATLRLEELAEVPEELWPLARFRMSSGFALVTSQVDANRTLDAVSEGEPVGTPEPGPSYTVVWRSEFVVWRKRISQPMYRTLEVLAAGGSVAEAMDAAVASWNGDELELAERIFAWFGEWLREGLFSAVVLPGQETRRRRCP